MSENIDEIRNLYDKRITSTKDTILAAGQWESKDYVPLICEEICQKINLKKSDIVLELGCGSGVLGNWINGRCSFYVGLDISFQMLMAFLKQPNSQKIINLIQSITGKVPLHDDHFDITIMNGVSMYLNQCQLEETLREMERVTRRKGIIFIGENIVPENFQWELVWFQNLSNSKQRIARQYIKFRKLLAQINPKLAGKWKSIHKEIKPEFINKFFEGRGIVIQSNAASYTVKKKILGNNYKGNKRVDFLIKLDE